MIDSHTHIFPPEIIKERKKYAEKDSAFGLLYGDPDAKMITSDELVKNMESEGVDVSVACGFPWSDPGLCRVCNDYLLDGYSRFKDRIVPFLMPPLPSAGERRIRKEIERCISGGAAGMGEVALYTNFDSAYLKKLCELSIEFNIPVLIHANETVGHYYPGKTENDLKELYRLAIEHPAAKIILAHWGGGLFFYELMPEVKKALKNVYYDTAATPYIYAPEIYKVAIEIVGYRKILFGSDFPLIRPKRYLQHIYQQVPDNEARKHILGKNAASLFLDRTKN